MTNLSKFKEFEGFEQKLALFIVSFAGTGLLTKKAPGTVGSFIASLVVLVLSAYQLYFQQAIDVAFFMSLSVYSFILGWIATILYYKATSERDPGYIVIDEAAAIFFVNAMIFALVQIPGNGIQQANQWLNSVYPVLVLLNFIIFRIFDIFKFGPIKWFDKNFKTAFALMFDDTLAALLTIAVMALGIFAYQYFILF